LRDLHEGHFPPVKVEERGGPAGAPGGVKRLMARGERLVAYYYRRAASGDVLETKEDCRFE
jgi:hypothetical protein